MWYTCSLWHSKEMWILSHQLGLPAMNGHWFRVADTHPSRFPFTVSAEVCIPMVSQGPPNSNPPPFNYTSISCPWTNRIGDKAEPWWRLTLTGNRCTLCQEPKHISHFGIEILCYLSRDLLTPYSHSTSLSSVEPGHKPSWDLRSTSRPVGWTHRCLSKILARVER